MQVTNELLATYIGGQAEVQNPIMEYLFRGEVKDITINDATLVVRFAWIAKGAGYPPIPRFWINDARLNYSASLENHSCPDIGNDRICFNLPTSSEIIILYPPNGSKLDPSKVRGLNLEKAS